MDNYNMRPNASTGYPGRTHRFYTGTPTWPFGTGLSYTEWAYSAKIVAPGQGQGQQAAVAHRATTTTRAGGGGAGGTGGTGGAATGTEGAGHTPQGSARRLDLGLGSIDWAAAHLADGSEVVAVVEVAVYGRS